MNEELLGAKSLVDYVFSVSLSEVVGCRQWTKTGRKTGKIGGKTDIRACAAQGRVRELKFCVADRWSVGNNHVSNGWRASATRSAAVAPFPETGARSVTGRRRPDTTLAHKCKVVCHQILRIFPDLKPVCDTME